MQRLVTGLTVNSRANPLAATRRERDMYLAQGPQDIKNAEVVIVLAVIFLAAFWRAVLRLALAAIVAVVVVAVAYGLIAFVQGAHP